MDEHEGKYIYEPMRSTWTILSGTSAVHKPCDGCRDCGLPADNGALCKRCTDLLKQVNEISALKLVLRGNKEHLMYVKQHIAAMLAEPDFVVAHGASAQAYINLVLQSIDVILDEGKQ
jgi:hypothetical protein